jgi:hypothetical protein
VGAVAAPHASAAPCDPPITSEIACENSKPGSPASEWDVQGAGDSEIQGFATDISVNQGQTIAFKVDTAATDYRLDIYRMGWYGGDGARHVATVDPTAPIFEIQPDCLPDDETGLIDCGNWSQSAAWTVPGDAVSGIYFAKLVREDLTPGESHIVFVVRDDDGGSELLFQTADTTWQAYNRYGGNSLYTGSPAGRAYKVSYNRPFTTREYAPEDWVFNAEYPMVRWLERNGYDVSYTTGVDSHRRGGEILEHDTFLSVGHDEYWSGGQRANVEAARGAGVNLAFFSGNEVFWKTRWEPSVAAGAAPNRTLVSYKETHAGAKIDPQPGVWTGTWRDPRFSPPADGGRPENALTGQLFTINDGATTAIRVPAADGKMRFWRHTEIAGLAAGQEATLAPETLGYEWDEDIDNGHRPPGSIRMSTTTVQNAPALEDHGSTFGRRTATHHLTLYKHQSGALVFGAGTVQWPWGLDADHDRGNENSVDSRMQQATVNLFADMGSQPATLQGGLTQAAGTTDVAAPLSAITSPVDGATAQVGTSIQITGHAADGEAGGRVAGVEVSTDNGQTWHPATGREDWSYTWTPQATGTVTLRSRSIDDSGNIQSPSASATITVAEEVPNSCPCSVFDPAAAPGNANLNDGSPLEVGMKFRADDDGYVTALRFYKGAGNEGTHTGHLWSATGERLAEARFTNETASGWQQVKLLSPVPVARDATYVVSYHSPEGGYAADDPFFVTPVDNPPLHALADGLDGGNGVYRYGESGFPTSSWNSSNYWVDVVFEQEIAPDTTAPQVTSVAPPGETQDANPGGEVSAVFDEALDPATLTTSNFTLRRAGGASVSADVSYDASTGTATLTPSQQLDPGTAYTATLQGGSSGIADLAGNRLAQDRSWSFTTSVPRTCPCSLFAASAVPTQPDAGEGTPVEVGVKFRADEDGYVTGLRFYKGIHNTGTHVGHLWTRGGRKLAEATFTSETASGWQQVQLGSPVPVSANATYVASYHSHTGAYALDEPYFGSSVDNPPLHGLANGVDGGNGVYRYGSSSFPTQSFAASNYWVDVVFERDGGPDTTPPQATPVRPVDGAQEVSTQANVSVSFSEPLQASTLNTSTFNLRAPGGAQVQADVSYDLGESTATLTPQKALQYSTTYTATVSGGSAGVADRAGNRMQQDRTWSFETEPPPPPPPTQGPGGPILVVGSAANPFGTYNSEILRAEGLNQFAIAALSSVTAQTLSNHQVVVLGEAALSDAQVAMFTNWVQNGGNLIAMRPDKKLASLLGLADAGGTLSEAYMRVDPDSSPGTGITGQTMQFHGSADRYTLDGARQVAALYADAASATANPAVTVNNVGSSGGQAAAFTYDLARSVVYTRQGNPAWSGDERDGFAPIRSDDLFFGAAASNPVEDWVDFDRVAVPQADEQQRLLANLITDMNLDRAPLPRFWYLPRGENAAVVMTGDDHAHNGTTGQFDRFKAASAPGCSVADWECVRATSYVYPDTPISDAAASQYEAEGFELALHVNTGCANFTRTALDAFFDGQLATFSDVWPSVAPPRTNRTHCIAYSDWASTPKSELAHGIRLDTNYYYWPQSWVLDRPGLFTGSGIPMRFADVDGSMIDVYQATTQLTDESGQDLPLHINALINNALGPQGYYGVFTTNMHTDTPVHEGADAIVAEAQARGVPVITTRQLLAWLDGRNNSAFKNLSFTGDQLRFTIDRAPGARGLEAMVPAVGPGGPAGSLTRNGVAVSTTERVVKGVRYLVFDAVEGDYVASYLVDDDPPVISGTSATARADGTATIAWTTDEPASSRVQYGTSPAALTQEVSDAARVTDHALELNNLDPGTSYYYRVSSTDSADNTASFPAAANPPASFGTPASLTDSTTADFAAGTRSGTYAGASGDAQDGEVQLSPTVAEEFDGPQIPAAWSVTPWTAGGTGSIVSSALTVDGARAGTTATYSSGRSLEFFATLGGAPFRHVGFGVDFNNVPWTIFSTGGGALPTGLYARTAGSATANTAVPGVPATSPQRYRIDWTSTTVQYSVNRTQVASHTSTISAAMRPLESDFSLGAGDVRVHWLRMSPYPSTGTFTSRVLDAGSRADWGALDSTSVTPAGTTVAFETRSGDSPTPDGTWSAWEAIGSGGNVASPNGRFVQYRATLSTGSPRETPTLERVRIEYVAAP